MCLETLFRFFMPAPPLPSRKSALCRENSDEVKIINAITLATGQHFSLAGKNTKFGVSSPNIQDLRPQLNRANQANSPIVSMQINLCERARGRFNGSSQTNCMPTIAEMLKTNRGNLQSLDLSRNFINDASLTLLLDALRQNQQSGLKVLGLKGHNLSLAGLQNLNEFLRSEANGDMVVLGLSMPSQRQKDCPNGEARELIIRIRQHCVSKLAPPASDAEIDALLQAPTTQNG